MSEETCDTINAPNWMKELEAKREKRLKAKLGHEAGAGSPCLQCKEGCPGLDLHFWRKICKNCKCGKENHDVHDDDIHGWAQFQLLGSKPKKPEKIVLPGEKEEIELEWTPKGSKEAIANYLKDLPPEQLPIKGTSAAKERKQMLQKQIPIHDIDPTLCHALTEEETQQMNDYINHLKENSVGVGQMIQIRKPISAKLISNTIPGHVSMVENTHHRHAKLSGVLQNTGNLNKNLQNLNLNVRDNNYQMNHENSFIPIKEDSNPIYANIESLKSQMPHYVPGSFNTFQETRNPHRHAQSKDLFANMYATRPIKHDYENIDEFGKHKLEASLEELEKKQRFGTDIYEVRSNHILDKYGNPIHAQYAMLLDKSSLPIKDKFDAPIRSNLDAFGRPILDVAVVEKIGPLAKAEYAIMLDKNGAPMLDKYGNAIKNTIEYGLPLQQDKFGNDIKPHFAILLDRCADVIKDTLGSPIKTNLDASGRPILDDGVVEKLPPLSDPQYAMMIDKNGGPILDKYGNAVRNYIDYGTPVVRDVVLDKFGNELVPYYALLIDKSGVPIEDKMGSPIKTKLDSFGRPVFDESVNESLRTLKPEYALLLDRNGALILDKYGNPVKNDLSYIKPMPSDTNEVYATKEIKPYYAMLLDKTGTPIKDKMGNPIKTQLDRFGNPIFDQIIIERLGKSKPIYAMLLDKNCAPILDKYGNTIKNSIEDLSENVPRAILLDAAENPILNQFGAPYEVKLDENLKPLVEESFVFNTKPKYALLLDKNRKPILDSYNNPIKIDLDETNNSIPINFNNATILDQFGRPILDKFGIPVILKQDAFGRAVLDATFDPNQGPIDLHNATLLGKTGLPILDNHGHPIKLNVDEHGNLMLHNTGLPVLDHMGACLTQNTCFMPVLDKYGNSVDPNTGRVIPKNELSQYIPQNQFTIPENAQNPTPINIGAINDIEYAKIAPNYETNPNYENNRVNPTMPNDFTNESIPECHKCKQIFEENAVVIQIERTDALWHATCFKCAGCNQNLADLLYFYHKETDDIYCGRDFAKIRGIPRCNACDELIFVKEYCLAENSTYHVKHFCCFECDEPLAGFNYVIENGQTVCITCYENLKADRCNTCSNIIKPNEQGVNLNGTHFHAQCFACKTCEKPLLNLKFLFRSQILYCSGACFNQDSQQN